MAAGTGNSFLRELQGSTNILTSVNNVLRWGCMKRRIALRRGRITRARPSRHTQIEREEIEFVCVVLTLYAQRRPLPHRRLQNYLSQNAGKSLRTFQPSLRPSAPKQCCAWVRGNLRVQFRALGDRVTCQCHCREVRNRILVLYKCVYIWYIL